MDSRLITQLGGQPIRREAVLNALKEFDEIGRWSFLSKYGYGAAKRYFVLHKGRLYDSKAIAGVAAGLPNSRFSGGIASALSVLSRLGFRWVDQDGIDVLQTQPIDDWPLRPGQALDAAELSRRFGVAGGWRAVDASRTTPDVLLFTALDAEAPRQAWGDDGRLYCMGNRLYDVRDFGYWNTAVLQHARDGKALRVFERAGDTFTYVGRFVLDDETPWLWLDRVGVNESQAEVLFCLVPFDVTPATDTPTRQTFYGRPFAGRDPNVRPLAAVTATDPDTSGRGLRAHRALELWLAERARESGWVPLDPESADPQFDLAWFEGEVLRVAEVKSLTMANEAGQIRTGLGQVLDYQFRLRERVQGEVRAVLFVERQPHAPHWRELCRNHGVDLAWPDLSTGVIHGL